mgnify:CR=1 FL=1
MIARFTNRCAGHELALMNNCKGFTLIELIASLVILSVLAAILIPRYIDAETASKNRAIDLGVAELNVSMPPAFSM